MHAAQRVLSGDRRSSSDRSITLQQEDDDPPNSLSRTRSPPNSMPETQSPTSSTLAPKGLLTSIPHCTIMFCQLHLPVLTPEARFFFEVLYNVLDISMWSTQWLCIVNILGHRPLRICVLPLSRCHGSSAPTIVQFCLFIFYFSIFYYQAFEEVSRLFTAYDSQVGLAGMFKYQHVAQGVCVCTQTHHYIPTQHKQTKRHMYIYRRARKHHHTHTHSYTHKYLCVCVCVCMYVCIYVCMYIRMYVCMYVCMYI